MARKTLLTEAEIRSFMKLANLTPVGDARLQEWRPPIEEELPPEEDEEGLPSDDAAAVDDMEMDADLGAVDDMEMDAELDADLGDDLGAEEGPATDLGGGDKEDQFMDLVQQLADLVGVDVEMDDGEAVADAEMEMGDDVDSLEGGDDLGDEAALDADLGGEEEAPMGDELPPEEDEEDLPGMRSYQEGKTDAIVSEVAKRVAERLRSEDSKQKVVDQLAERIFTRLTSK